MDKKYQLFLGMILYIIAICTNQFFLYFISYIILSYDIMIKACKNIAKKEVFDENFLMLIATIGAFVIKEYAEAVIVMLLYQIGEVLSDLAIDNSKEKIITLMDLRSDKVRVVEKEQEKIKNIEGIKIGEIIQVNPGEKVPLDGIMLSKDSNLDMRSLTGESLPVQIKQKDKVLSGSVVLNKPIEIKVTNTIDTSTVTRIYDFMNHAMEKKTETEKFITKFAKIYTPIICLIALFLCLIPIIFHQDFSIWFYKALMFLVISCPCALVISVPLSFFCGIGRATKEGILCKSTDVLEKMSNLKIILYDKTGTLTKGNLEVTKISHVKQISKEKLIEYATAAEFFSNHPVKKAIIDLYKGKIKKQDIKRVEEKAGYGICCQYQGKKLLAGNEKLMKKEKVKYEKTTEIGTIIYISYNNHFCGYFVINDILKEKSKETIENLKEMGIEQIILTGDNKKLTKEIAKDLNILYFAELLPQEKAKIVKEYVEKGEKSIAFVGDGINDAPALITSDIGISMGSCGSDAAMEASDMVLIKDDLSKLVEMIKISKYTVYKAKQNIILAIGFKIIILLFGILGYTSIWLAIFADVGVTLIAILNSLLILKEKKR